MAGRVRIIREMPVTPSGVMVANSGGGKLGMIRIRIDDRPDYQVRPLGQGADCATPQVSLEMTPEALRTVVDQAGRALAL